MNGKEFKEMLREIIESFAKSKYGTAVFKYDDLNFSDFIEWLYESF